MIYKIAWGVSLILIGLMLIPVSVPYLSVLAGISLIVAGVAFIAGI